MDFALSHEQEMVVDTVRSFVETELYPLEQDVERRGECPRELGEEIQRKVMELGFYAPNIPEEYGGAGLPLSAAAAILEEVQRAGGNGAACQSQSCGADS